MPKSKLTFDEIIGLTDEVAAVVGAIKTIIATAKDASADGEVSEEEVLAINEQVQKGIDALQALSVEVIAEATD